jgi:hypothetical protein
LIPVVFGFAAAVPPCTTTVYTRGELTAANDVRVPADAWVSPIQINPERGTRVVSVIVTDAGVDVRDGRPPDQ